jgi:hypothetical protein
MKTRKIAKCAGCCPTEAATSFQAIGSEWVCDNCFHRMPRRINKPTPKITPSQKKVIDLLVSMGWTVKTEFIGRKVWITGECGNRWYDGDRFHGTISPGGAYELNATSFGKSPKITDRAGINTYLAVKVYGEAKTEPKAEEKTETATA